ncbi:MAG TPA: hypothetical protein VNZ55_05965 [Thermomicrobiales bacterium]|nr:hypothetical protein [Thermomicrobiales bacterium]
MTSSGRTVGLILIAAGIVVGIAITAWILFGVNEGNLRGSGAALGFVLLFGVIVLPLVGGGIFMLVKGNAERKDMARIQEQRALIDIVKTRGQVQISDLVLELKSTKDRVQQDLYQLVGRGLFSGYVDWDKGVLYSVEAKQLNGRQTCPNCGGPLELGGKGLIKCPYCGAEIFL